jgi:hypothetical protein
MSTWERDGAGEAPYAGALGATRHEAVWLTRADGSAQRVEIVRTVNAATDAALAQAALAGTLHRIEGSDLAVPFVYHDPATRRFVLVVPAARAHEELRLRAELLLRLADETESVLPAYVREARSVIGPEGLRRLLTERPSSRPAAGSDARLESVVQREERLRERAESVLRREDELSLRVQEIEALSESLQHREEELAQRVRELTAREESLVDEERALLANKSALQTRERLLVAREESLAAREVDLAVDGLGEAEAHEAHPLDPEPLEAEPLEAAEGEFEHAEDDLTPLPHPPEAEAAAEGAHDTLEADEFEAVEEEAAEESGAPVPAVWQGRGPDAYAAVVDGEVRLWARGGPEDASRLTHGAATLVLQADPDSVHPLALLAVQGASPELRPVRAVLDLTRPDDRAVLETLARDFRLRLEVISPAGRALGSHAVAAPGEANAQRVLAVLGRRAPGSEEARRAEAERLVREGIASAEGDAFARAFDDESSLALAAGAERAVEAYLPLLEPATFERLLLARGVPATRIEAVGKRVILAALRGGVALPPALVRRATELGIAPDEKTLATRALTAFARSCDSGLDAIGRTPREAAQAWASLLAWAGRLGVTVPEAALEAVRTLFDPEDPAAVEPPDPRPVPAPEAVRAMSDEELVRWVDHPGARETVAREMARRDPVRFAPSLARALRLVGPDVAGELAAKMIRAGDALGDVWVELLGSRRPVAAAIAAVATAVVRLRRGLTPAVQRALEKDDPDWKLFAWTAGEFGAGAVRALGRPDELDVDRLAWMLAHVVRAGGGREVERVRTASAGAVAEAATRAVGRVDEARGFDAALRRGPGETEGERAAYAVLARVARAEGESRPTEGV